MKIYPVSLNNYNTATMANQNNQKLKQNADSITFEGDPYNIEHAMKALNEIGVSQRIRAIFLKQAGPFIRDEQWINLKDISAALDGMPTWDRTVGQGIKKYLTQLGAYQALEETSTWDRLINPDFINKLEKYDKKVFGESVAVQGRLFPLGND